MGSVNRIFHCVSSEWNVLHATHVLVELVAVDVYAHCSRASHGCSCVERRRARVTTLATFLIHLKMLHINISNPKNKDHPIHKRYKHRRCREDPEHR